MCSKLSDIHLSLSSFKYPCRLFEKLKANYRNIAQRVVLLSVIESSYRISSNLIIN